MKIPIIYTSTEGSTHHFLTKMSYLFHNVSLHRVDEQTDLFKVDFPYFVFVPAYATYEDSQKKCVELPQTYALTEQLDYKKNYQHAIGTVGSGNRNFSKDQWIWTAKLYKKLFNIPIIASYELRGTMSDENAINQKMVKIWNQKFPENPVKSHKNVQVNPRLAKLEKKFGRNLHGDKIN